MNKFYIMADPHGSFKPFRDFYNRIKNTISAEDKITIIVLGDFGANFFFNYRDEDFKKNKCSDIISIDDSWNHYTKYEYRQCIIISNAVLWKDNSLWQYSGELCD